MGGVGVVGGIASIVVIGFSAAIGLGVGLFFGILTLLLGYWFITLVAPSVEMWVNRSLVGSHEGQILPFGDMSAEQSSLEMVFQGVTVHVSLLKERVDINKYVSSDGHEIDVAGYKEKLKELNLNLSLKIITPQLKNFSLEYSLISMRNRRAIQREKIVYPKKPLEEISGKVLEGPDIKEKSNEGSMVFSLKKHIPDAEEDVIMVEVIYSTSRGSAKDTFTVEAV